MSGQTLDENSQEVNAGLRVRIRMYRQGLGDCFLLTFFKGAVVKHVLIDCGVLQGTPDGVETMQKVAAQYPPGDRGQPGPGCGDARTLGSSLWLCSGSADF